MMKKVINKLLYSSFLKEVNFRFITHYVKGLSETNGSVQIFLCSFFG